MGTGLREHGGSIGDRRLGRRAVLGWAALAFIVLATTADVLADGLLRHWDRDLMLGPDGLRLSSGGWFWFWRTVVWGGQYWLVASLAGLLALLVAWRRRKPWVVVVVGAWIIGDQAAVWAFKKVIGRTFPISGQDRLFTGAEAYPSGHAALAASCLLVIAALVPLLVAHRAATRCAIPAAYVLSVGATVATVMLGYHWPTDAIAGWVFGTGIGLFGCALTRRFAGPD